MNHHTVNKPSLFKMQNLSDINCDRHHDDNGNGSTSETKSRDSTSKFNNIHNAPDISSLPGESVIEGDHHSQVSSNDIDESIRSIMSEGTECSSSKSSSSGGGGHRLGSLRRHFHNQRIMGWVILLVLIVAGAGASALFLTIAISSSQEDQEIMFLHASHSFVEEFKTAFDDYKLAGQWVQETCSLASDMTRQDFEALYININSTGLEFQVMSWNWNISSAEQRAQAENEAKEYYATYYPELNITYIGINGLEPVDDQGTLEVLPRSEQPFYFPVHYLEPLEGNIAAIDFDLYSSASRRITINRIMETWTPLVTPRLQLVQETDPSAYSVILMHPGIPQTHPNLTRPASFTSIVLRIPDLLELAARLSKPSEAIDVYIFDVTDHEHGGESLEEPVFLGGANIPSSSSYTIQNDTLTFKPELLLADLRALHQRQKYEEETITILSDQKWLLAVVQAPNTYHTDLTFVILAGTLLFLLVFSLGLFVYVNMRRMSHLAQLRARSQKERATLIVENAKAAAKSERELNDFIAHEVRNPLAAAMSACTFVHSAVQELELPPQKSIPIQEDISIMDASLHFINDLLRNMLDIQRARHKQLEIVRKPTHVLLDILKPVVSMLHHRDTNFKVLLECDPPEMTINADPLRLKQIILNLARNSIKFVERGFIKLTARVVNDKTVQFSVEDSGPGIPAEKREELFGKFQSSLDSLNQGTGIGLSLCKQLVGLMDGTLGIDETYHSGIEGCPGARFVVTLKTTSIEWTDAEHEILDEDMLMPLTAPKKVQLILQTSTRSPVNESNYADEPVQVVFQEVPRELPENWNVLFVDDDMVLRKLFTRTVKRVVPSWNIEQASNGETAVEMTKTERFDMIFMDQYMASVTKQLLGTEATRLLRAQGCESMICGLSANDVEPAFVEAGADAFMLKPFPCKVDLLKEELLRVIFDCERGRKRMLKNELINKEDTEEGETICA